MATFRHDPAAGNERPPRLYPRFFYPGEQLSPDELRVTMLGSGSPVTRRAQAAPGILVETGDDQIFVMDFGSGCFANLTSLEIPQRRFTKVFLTNLHCDHWADLTHLHAVSLIYGRTEPLQIWGPSGAREDYGTAAWARGFEQAMAWDIASRRGKAVSGPRAHELEVHEFDYREPAWIYDEAGLRIKAFPAVHCIDGPVSYRVEWNGRSLVFTGDTKPNRFFMKHAREADLMIHETFLPAELHAEKSGIDLASAQNIVNGVHSPPRSAGRAFAETRPRLAVMYRLRMNEGDEAAVLDDLRSTYDGPVVMARDLMVFNVAPDQVTQRMAVTPELAQPVFERPEGQPVQREDSVELSAWLREAQLPVDGVEYPGAQVF